MSSSHYQRQRRRMLDGNPGMESFLPKRVPELPPPPRPTWGQLRKWIGPAANTNADRCIIAGWGDGYVMDAALDDSVMNAKEILVLIFSEEGPAVARSMHYLDLAKRLQHTNVKLMPVASERDIRDFCQVFFTGREQIVTIAGLDIVSKHPLSPAAAAQRKALLPVLERILAQRPMMLGNDIGDSFLGFKYAAINAKRLIDKPDLTDLDGIFGDTPVISIAAGPSLKEHLPALRELQDRCVLVACDAVFAGLLDAGIDPHFVTPLERIENTANMLARAGESRAYYAGLPLIRPEGLAGFSDDRLLFIAAGDQLYDWLDPENRGRIYSGSSTGVFSVAFAQHITRGPVYLVGHDLSLSDGVSHWEGADEAARKWKKKLPFTVPGNNGKAVRTSQLWSFFRDEIIELIIDDKHGVVSKGPHGRKHYNVNAHTQTGARIDGCEPSPLPDKWDLPALAWPDLSKRYPQRVAHLNRKLNQLSEDARAIISHQRANCHNLATIDLAILKEIDASQYLQDGDLEKPVSKDNQIAMTYIFRSAVASYHLLYHGRRRLAGPLQEKWMRIQCAHRLANSLSQAMEHLAPQLIEIANDH